MRGTMHPAAVLSLERACRRMSVMASVRCLAAASPVQPVLDAAFFGRLQVTPLCQQLAVHLQEHAVSCVLHITQAAWDMFQTGRS